MLLSHNRAAPLRPLRFRSPRCRRITAEDTEDAEDCAVAITAQIERDEGNTIAAIEAATQAYRKAWCDGPPFAYHWGRKAARAHLNALGAPEPSDLPPYDESKHEPMPEVEIDPPDLPVESKSTEE